MRWFVIAALVPFAASCGASFPEARTAATAGAAPNDARDEIASQRGFIVSQLDKIGLAPSPDEQPPGAGGAAPPPEAAPVPVAKRPVTVAESVEPTPDRADREEESPMASRPPRAEPVRPSEPSPAPMSVTSESKVSSRRFRSLRCRDISSAADAICHASDRICVLASQLADPDSTHSCTQSRSDCSRARSHASSCD